MKESSPVGRVGRVDDDPVSPRASIYAQYMVEDLAARKYVNTRA